ncbi:hypothetical protein [Photorhabdus tasmaniensis]|uniref:Uncharacterized protein n=1 Tax=Photorhabdus tasmaniensis TaxID=1004159 RepID=A0ABX0GNY2_9GAMM|nr:hypothetical protein [Photorhabdus tasmaniensis]NHB89932.1 hypothetical protein [Photorhabdus tasmaniensis]
MKLISLIKPIKVKYFGIELSVPFWTKFIVTDHNGIVSAQNEKPLQSNGSWISESVQYQYEIVAIVDLENVDWKDTLIQI